MLKLLRKKGVAKRVIWFVAIIIIISFGFLGTAYLLTDIGGSRHAGKIFGKKVSLDDFNAAYQQVRIQAMIKYGEKFNEVFPYLNLDAETWDRLILLNETSKRKIKVTDEEVVQAIQNYAFFQRNGQFDSLLYNDILRYVFKIKARNFEESVRDTIKFAKLYQQETINVTVDEQEVMDTFQKINEKIQISYVLISPEEFKDESLYDESKAQEFYENNQPLFAEPESINVEYFTLDLPESDSTDESTEENAETTEDTESEEELAKIKEKGNEIAQAMYDNEDLTKVAEQFDLELKESGFFSVDNPNLSLGWSYELLKEIFTLEENQISQPFETSNGIHIIKVKEKRSAYIPEYEDAKEKVKDEVLKNAAKQITAEKATEYLEKIKTEMDKTMLKDFAKAAKDLGLEISQTPVFNRGQYLPQIGISRTFQEAAFNLTQENKVSDVVETTIGYCILHLDESVPAEMDIFAEQKDRITQGLLTERRNQAFNTFRSRLRVEANLMDNIAKLRQEAEAQRQ